MNNAVNLFGMQLNPLRMNEVVDQLLVWAENPTPTEPDAAQPTCRYVVTPNVDHAVMFQKHAGLQRAYADASLVLADGFPVLAAARLLRCPIPERVPGSDLVPALFNAAQERSGDGNVLRVFLLGAGPGVAEQAAKNIAERWPSVEVVGTYSPPLGFEKDPAENENILKRISAARPNLLVVGLGAPKQELWVHAHREQISVPVVLCVGATIDFLAGEKARAPVWMRKVGLEWAHRLFSEPRRLAKRYLQDAWIFPRLVFRQWASDHRAVTPSGGENASGGRHRTVAGAS
jgi:N-acetylglucosaminyldiphosphoundecaprenol N-acetyl-beta-D-mannosaminyltransferase